MKRRFVGSEFQRATDLGKSQILLSPPGRNAGKQSVGIGVVRLRRQDRVRLRLGIVGPASGKEHVSQIDPRLVVCRLQIDGPLEFAVSGAQGAHMEVSLRQGIMRLGEVFVDLQGVGILNGGFPVLALGAILLSALQIFLFSHVWIAEAPGQ